MFVLATVIMETANTTTPKRLRSEYTTTHLAWLRSYEPRFSTEARVAAYPAKGSHARVGWVRDILPSALLNRVPRATLESLIRGVEIGGVPPSKWAAEPNSPSRMKDRERGGHGSALPLALDLLCGARPHRDGRGHIVRSLANGHYRPDIFVEALLAAGEVAHRDELASWFNKAANDQLRLGVLVWHYQKGCFVEQRSLCPQARKWCARARDLLLPKPVQLVELLDVDGIAEMRRQIELELAKEPPSGVDRPRFSNHI